MVSKHNIRLNPNRNKAVHTGIAFASGDKGITLVIEVEEMDCSNTTAKIVFKRSNGTSVEADITGSNNVYTYELRGNELEIPGLVVADVKFYEGTKRISTATFTFTASGDTMDGLGAGAGGYSDRLEQLAKEAQTITADAEKIKEDLQRILEEYQTQLGNVGAVSGAGYYDQEKYYVVNNVVFHDGYSWLCLKNCKGQEPTGTSACWQKFTTGVPVDLVDTATGVACTMTIEDGIITIREA